MQQLSFVLIQLLEAKRYIQAGKLPYLRLALLLLDNVAEIQMHRTIEGELMHEDFTIKMKNLAGQIQQVGASDLPPSLTEVMATKTLSRKERRNVDLYFNEKLKYLCEKGYLESSTADVLGHMHQYRNEAYHRAEIRKETILSAALILLDLNCELLLKLPPSSMAWSSEDDYRFVEELFDFKSVFFAREEELPKIIEKIRSGLPMNDTQILTALQTHLSSRIEDVYKDINFIVENGLWWLTGGEHHTPLQEAAALKLAQFCAEVPPGGDFNQAFGSFTPKYDFARIERLKSRANTIGQFPTRIEGFRVFAELETELEPLEKEIHTMTMDIDRAIQLEIDIRRGK